MKKRTKKNEKKTEKKGKGEKLAMDYNSRKITQAINGDPKKIVNKGNYSYERNWEFNSDMNYSEMLGIYNSDRDGKIGR